ncbi:MAG: ATP-grasp domain-containing protein [Gemmatimonadota bacterium]|nr:MAG: ATP-grasp domain-containing protein [Gemmatimonadota bacterium]
MDEIAELEAIGGERIAPAQSTLRIISTLEALGYRPVELILQPGKTDEWLSRLIAGDFRIAFNLCETLAGRADGEHLTAAAVELLGLPMTGASSATLLYCLNKDRCSAVLGANGIRVPEWRLVRRADPLPEDWTLFPAIAKPAADDASNGVHANSVVHSRAELLEAVQRLHQRWNLAMIQQFIEGREINLAIVGRFVLPPAEIDFTTLPDGSPPIVSFEAKWESGSPEDLGTRPICPAPLPPQQAKDLQHLAVRAWKAMDGQGYARVDIRLTDEGVPYVIDINPNPDLSIDAGLARQARVAGWSYDELIGKIAQEALSRFEAAGLTDEDWIFVPARTAEGEIT